MNRKTISDRSRSRAFNNTERHPKIRRRRTKLKRSVPGFFGGSDLSPPMRGRKTPVPADSLLALGLLRKTALIPDPGCGCCRCIWRGRRAEEDSPVGRPRLWECTPPLASLCLAHAAYNCCLISCCCCCFSWWNQLGAEEIEED